MRRQINTSQRYQISALLKANVSKQEIAKQLGYRPSSIYREINRNSKRTKKGDVYDPAFADHLCQKRHERKKKCIRLTEAIKRRIRWLIKQKWSPEQIYNVTKQRKIPMVSIETIYQYLYGLKRKGIDFCIYLRRSHRKRRKRRLNRQPRQIIKQRKSIHQRPPAAQNASRLGHMEIDLMKCKNGYLMTMTDRKCLYNIIRKIPNKSSASVLKALESIKDYAPRIKTITSDNGLEFTQHKKAEKILNVKWFFADPYCSQQRGCNENQNGLIRQFANRKTDLNNISEQQINLWQKQLNFRPRKKLNFKKPIQIFNANKFAFIS